MNKKLIIAVMLTVSLFCVGFSGETATTILGGAIAGCALNEAYNDVKTTPAPEPIPRADYGNEGKSCFEQCDARYPTDNGLFMQCMQVCTN